MNRAAWSVLAGLAFSLCPACSPARAPPLESGRTVHVVAERYAFSPARIEVRRGARTVLELASRDVAHGFSIPELRVRADVAPGAVTRIEVAPERAGTYAIQCDVFCGDGHDDMSAELVVTD